MILSDFHMHTKYCDGSNTVEEMVKAAVGKGMTAMGFSGHSYAPYDTDCCMSPEGTLQYRREVERYKELCEGIIKVCCGIEQDIYAPAPQQQYDYVIGSVHYIGGLEDPLPVDYKPEILKRLADERFGGDIYALCGAYFEAVSQVVERTGCDIIGHFDLVSKFNEGDRLFDSSKARYVKAWQDAADKLLKTGALFEINTGAMSRGYRSGPYPSDEMIKYISERGGRFVLSSDAHSADGIMYGFTAQEKRLSEMGILLVDFSEFLEGKAL
ncbi:MAG: histidinol-phosphatase [Clostridia bacterium]|nr:histidinol-phosphatase [Clostridia bacterium]